MVQPGFRVEKERNGMVMGSEQEVPAKDGPGAESTDADRSGGIARARMRRKRRTKERIGNQAQKQNHTPGQCTKPSSTGQEKGRTHTLPSIDPSLPSLPSGLGLGNPIPAPAPWPPAELLEMLELRSGSDNSAAYPEADLVARISGSFE